MKNLIAIIPGFLIVCTTMRSYAADHELPHPASDSQAAIRRLPAPFPVHQHDQVQYCFDRANMDGDGSQMIGPFISRAESTVGIEKTIENTIPVNFSPWWDRYVRNGEDSGSELSVDVSWLIQSALTHSPKLRTISTEPRIRKSLLLEEQAGFDWTAYLNSKYDDLNDPVGNTLTTGNNDDRFEDRVFSGQGGLRRRHALGGNFEISQRLGQQSNNSRFLFPNPQGTSRLELNFTQPLLNGAGYAYNHSEIFLAHLNLQATEDEVAGEIEEHLLNVTKSYWDMFRARAEYVQRKRLLSESVKILDNLSGRQEVDSLQRQILRARAAVANRQSEIARAKTSIRNAESRLRLLVNDPILLNGYGLEFIPREAPLHSYVPIAMGDSLTTALKYRPDISRAIRDVRATTVRLGVSRNEVLPKLDLVVSTYVAGLDGNDSRIFSSFNNQFRDGRPGYSVGLQFEVPLGNRAPRARMQRRYWEMQRAFNQFRSTVEESLTEVELSVREVQTSHQEMFGKYQAMIAADQETIFLEDRWKFLPGENDSATLLLEDLLDSQERRADEEAAFVQAQISYAISIIELRKAMGTLLQCDSQIETSPIVLENARGNSPEFLGGSRRESTNVALNSKLK